MCAPCFKYVLPQQCPTCRGQYDAPVRRSLLAEELVSSATFAVSCGNMACQELFVGRELETHMTYCQHRAVPCPFSACNGAIALESAIQHIVVHQAVEVQVNGNYLTISLDLTAFMNGTCGDWRPMVRV